MSFIKGYKSYIVAALLVVVALLDVLTGDMTLSVFLNSPELLILLNGVGLAALRHGME